MKKLLLIVTILFLSFHPSICFSDSIGLVEEYLKFLSNPNLSDYRRFYGRMGLVEFEWRLVYIACREKGWIPPEQNVQCLHYNRARQMYPKNTTSLYMSWLRTKIPKYDKIEISEIKRFEGTGNWDYELIYVNLNNSKILFFRNLDQDKLANFGLIGVSEINRISVNELLEHDIDEGLIQNIIKDIY